MFDYKFAMLTDFIDAGMGVVRNTTPTSADVMLPGYAKAEVKATVDGRTVRVVANNKTFGRVEVSVLFPRQADLMVQLQRTDGAAFAQSSIAPNQRLAIGRGSDCAFLLAEPTVSRVHAELSCSRRGVLYIRDLGSSHGTFVGAQRVVGRRKLRVQDGEVLRLGRDEYCLRVSAASAYANVVRDDGGEKGVRSASEQVQTADFAPASHTAVRDVLQGGPSTEQQGVSGRGLKRNTKRRQLFDAQDDVDKKRAELIEEIERQLQTKTSIEPVFTLRWTLADCARTTA